MEIKFLKKKKRFFMIKETIQDNSKLTNDFCTQK